MSPTTLGCLEFELTYAAKKLVSEKGDTALTHTEEGQRLLKNLDVIQGLKAKKMAA